MSLKNDVLDALQNAEGYISGEELAAKFSKSRAAVWKAIKSLQKDGYKIDAVTNRGYALCGESTVINAEEISRHMKNKIISVTCVVKNSNLMRCTETILLHGVKVVKR